MHCVEVRGREGEMEGRRERGCEYDRFDTAYGRLSTLSFPCYNLLVSQLLQSFVIHIRYIYGK